MFDAAAADVVLCIMCLAEHKPWNVWNVNAA